MHQRPRAGARHHHLDSSRPPAPAQDFAKQQAQATGFDYRRLTDEFQERVLLECRARQVTPLIKQPGILVITDHGLYFQPLHNLAGGAVVKFHPASAITSLARRRVAMQPHALEAFLTATAATHYLAADQVCFGGTSACGGPSVCGDISTCGGPSACIGAPSMVTRLRVHVCSVVVEYPISTILNRPFASKYAAGPYCVAGWKTYPCARMR